MVEVRRGQLSVGEGHDLDGKPWKGSGRQSPREVVQICASSVSEWQDCSVKTFDRPGRGEFEFDRDSTGAQPLGATMTMVVGEMKVI